MGKLFDDIHTFERTNEFVKKREIPIGTKKPFSDYKGYIPTEDVIKLKIMKREPLRIRTVAPSGFLKSTLLKRIAYYLNQMKHKIMVFDPKGFEWGLSKFEGSGKGLLQNEYKDSLPIKQYIPSFLVKKLPKKMLKHYNVFSLKLENFNNIQAFMTMGMTGKGAFWMLRHLKENPNSNILDAVERATYDVKHAYKREGITSNLLVYKELGVFDENYPDIDITQDWKDGLIPVICFFEQDTRLCSLATGYILHKGYQHSIFKDKKQRKMAIFDDAYKLVGYNMPRLEYWSVEMILTLQIMARFFGWNTAICSHSLSLLTEEIDPQVNIDLIGKVTTDISRLTSTIANLRLIERLKTLYYEGFKKEWMFIYPDRIRFKTFFPLGAISGHSW